MIINPAYYPDTKTWELRDPHRVVAPTIRELLAKLKKIKPRTKWVVANYYPLGTPSPRPEWGVAPPSTAAMRHHLPPNARGFSPPSPNRARRGKYDAIREPVLQAWADGKTAPEIINIFHVDEQAVDNIIDYARSIGDPRATPRNKTAKLGFEAGDLAVAGQKS